MTSKELQESVKEMETAIDALNEASKAVSEARNNETNIRNRLNVLQREFDKQVKSLREAAPRGTDWSEKKSAKLTEAALGRKEKV